MLLYVEHSPKGSPERAASFSSRYQRECATKENNKLSFKMVIAKLHGTNAILWESEIFQMICV